MIRTLSALVWFVMVSAMTACGDGNRDNAEGAMAVHSKPAMAESKRSPGRTTAPITIEYEIMGMPVVGIPLSINVNVSSELDDPITVNYRIIDSTSLMFSESQSERVSLLPAGDQGFSAEQVTVIPQREGRLFLNVSAEVETETGMMAKVMAIPIQVGNLRPVPQVNAEGSDEQ